MHGWMVDWLAEGKIVWLYGWTNGCLDGWMVTYMDEWVVRGREECVDAWVDG